MTRPLPEEAADPSPPEGAVILPFPKRPAGRRGGTAAMPGLAELVRRSEALCPPGDETCVMNRLRRLLDLALAT